MLSKEEIRKQIAKKRDKIEQEFIKLSSEIIQDKVISLKEYIHSECIYIYMSFGKEVDTKEIILHALENKKRVAIPKIVDKKMQFYYIKDFGQTKLGYFGIQEPITNDIAKEDVPFMIMPGAAFDYSKHRIGYGKGFYDQYLNKEENKNIKKVAIAFDFQILDEIPSEKEDVSPDMIITEKQIIL
jgi:5-formyltetrahydrofolate cyclo-ligase